MFKKIFAVGFILVAGAASAMAAGVDSGLVKDNNGNNVVGATVTYTRAPNTWTAITNANGFYRFNLGGTQSLTIIGSSATAGTLGASMVGYVNSAAGALTVTPADTTTGSGANAILNANLIMTIQSTTGTVVDSFTNIGITGATIQQKRGATILKTVTTNGSGVYNDSLVANGDTLIVTAPSYLMKKVVENGNWATTNPNTINIPINAFGRVDGLVLNDSLTGALISGATVAIAKVVGGVPGTTFAQYVTTAPGYFLFDSVSAHYAYQVTASAPGHMTLVKQIASKLVGVDSLDFTLGPVTANISGTVTSDSANGKKLVGATVVLTKGASTTAVATTTTNASGAYTFTNDSVGLSYTVTASYNGFQNTPVTFTKTVATDVENIVMQPGSLKTFWVKVINGTTSALLGNASVGFTHGTSVIGGITNATTGVFQVTNAPAGFDTVTAAATLFLDRQMIINNNAHAADTIFDTLTQVATGTVQRTIGGTAHKLTATGAVAAGVNILFKCAGGYVYDAVALTNGTWSIVGIDASIPATGSIPAYSALTGLGMHDTLHTTTAPRDTFWTYNNAAAINSALAATTTYNTVILNGTTGVLPQVAEKAIDATPAFSVLHSGIISLKNMNDQGEVKVFNLQGRMLYSHAFAAHTASLQVPALMHGGTAFIVSITQSKAEFKRVIMMP